MGKQEFVIKRLDDLKIDYGIVQHKAVYTIEEMDELGISREGDVVKNLFLRDSKGKRHFLVVLQKNKKVDFDKISHQIKSTLLSFASEERLEKYLKLGKGAVSPLGLLNDEACQVEVFFDKDLIGKQKLGIHPNENTATLWISFNNLLRVIEDIGHTVKYIEI